MNKEKIKSLKETFLLHDTITPMNLMVQLCDALLDESCTKDHFHLSGCFAQDSNEPPPINREKERIWIDAKYLRKVELLYLSDGEPPVRFGEKPKDGDKWIEFECVTKD